MELTEDELVEIKDVAYIEGTKAFARHILNTALAELDNGESRERLLIERSEIVSALRKICEDFGDNDWDDSAHLPDVIEKHLAYYLEEQDE